MQNEELIQQIELSRLKPFPDHPFQVRDDDAMQQTVESITNYGVLVPGIARPLDDGNFEIISGHRRKHACELAGFSSMPVIVRNLSSDEATIIMVDSNLQREDILPSERAKAYKMKLEAIKRHAGRPTKGATENLPQVAENFRADDEVAKDAGISGDTVRRYIRLTERQPALLDMVDEGKIGLTPAVELSYLKPEEQQMLLTAIDSEQATPSLSQAQHMKKISQSGELNDDTMLSIMLEQKKPDAWNLTIPVDKIKKYFPRSYTPKRMEEVIFKLLDAWQKKRQKDQTR